MSVHIVFIMTKMEGKVIIYYNLLRHSICHSRLMSYILTAERCIMNYFVGENVSVSWNNIIVSQS